MPEAIAQRVARAINEKVFPGCVIGIVRADGTREVMPFGNFTYENGSPRVREDTIYDLASVTKSIPIASLALMFSGEGQFSLDDAVTKFVPELQNDFGATIEDLLRYRVAGVQMSKLKGLSADEIEDHVLEHGFDGPPGKSAYANLPAFVLGLVIERAANEDLDSLARRYFFGPLRMRDTFFSAHRPAATPLERIAPAEIDEREGEIRGVVHDESARVFSRAHRAVGHAGLFSTAGDILNFLEALLSGDYAAVLDGAQRGLGWQIGEPFLGSEPIRRFGKTGFTGTSVLCDVERGIALAILSNRPYPKRPRDPALGALRMNAVRAEIAGLLH